MALYKLKSDTYKLSMFVTILGVIQSSDTSFLGGYEGLVLMGVGVLIAILREMTDRPMSDYKRVDEDV